ncbi:MAG: hypothetical protein K0R48_397, partial [Gammaproteobacteria bacterium]|nr:hypothetical protein [Gammaproteobacteria bacterium]
LKDGKHVPEFTIKLLHDPHTGIVTAKCSGPNGFPEGFKQMLAVYREAGAKTIKININKKTGESDKEKQGREYTALCEALGYGLVPALKRENSLYESLEFFKRQERTARQMSPQDANDPEKYVYTKVYIKMIVKNEASLARLLDEMPLEFDRTKLKDITEEQKCDQILSYIVRSEQPAVQKQQEQKMKVEPHKKNRKDPNSPRFLGNCGGKPNDSSPDGSVPTSRSRTEKGPGAASRVVEQANGKGPSRTLGY